MPWYTLLEVPTRFLAAILFFIWGLSELYYYPLAHHPRALWLASPPFLVSLGYVLTTLNGVTPFAELGFLLFLSRVAFLFLALTYTLDNYYRYRVRAALHYDIQRIYTNSFPDNGLRFDFSQLVATLETLGWNERFGGVTTFDGETGGRKSARGETET
jgi:hypothetical protein